MEESEMYELEELIEKPYTNDSDDEAKEEEGDLKEEDLGTEEESKQSQPFWDVSNSFIDVKTGITHPMMKVPPYHIKDAEEFEPLYTPRDNILEDCLRREAEWVAH